MNPGPQDGRHRWNQWAMAATLWHCSSETVFFQFFSSFLKKILKNGPWRWSSGQSARLLSLTIRVWIPLKLKDFFCKFVFEKNENKQKEAVVGPFFEKNWFEAMFLPRLRNVKRICFVLFSTVYPWGHEILQFLEKHHLHSIPLIITFWKHSRIRLQINHF